MSALRWDGTATVAGLAGGMTKCCRPGAAGVGQPDCASAGTAPIYPEQDKRETDLSREDSGGLPSGQAPL